MSPSDEAQTEAPNESRTSLARLQSWAFSVPLFLKIVGIVLLVSAVFAAVVYYQVRANISRVHNQINIQNANRAATSLASRLEHSNHLKDTELINHAINEIREAFTDVIYVLVVDTEDRIVAHYFGFPTDVTPELPRKAEELCSTCHLVPEESGVPPDLFDAAAGLEERSARRFSRPMGTIFEASAPIAGGVFGSVRVGHDDSSINRDMSAINSALVRSLIICLIVGQGLALLLTYVLVRPILNLVGAANAIGAGDFTARAKVSSADEIGRLGRVFNSMAEELEAYQAEVQEKEAFRLGLIDQIVRAQHEDQGGAMPELHDQLGQSLYRLLLLHQDIQGNGGNQNPQCDELEANIRELLDDVRRLAWDVRPKALDEFGLDSALQQYVEKVANRAGLQIDYQCASALAMVPVRSEIEVILYRVAQEAITNIVRHADAKRASVILLGHDSEVTLLIEDDGCGFDVPEVFQSSVTSLGLMGIKERLELAGGTLTVESEPNKGTSIRARIPIPE